jgi:hypothetical protein
LIKRVLNQENRIFKLKKLFITTLRRKFYFSVTKKIFKIELTSTLILPIDGPTLKINNIFVMIHDAIQAIVARWTHII